MTIERNAPSVSTIPSHDPAFRRVVESVLSPGASVEEVTARLRPLYPQVAVFARVLSGERRHLYVYRDGAYHREPAERWWDEPGVACVCVSAETGRLTYVSAEWAELMAGDAHRLLGRHYTDFVLPDARPTAAAMFDALLAARDVDSEARVVRADGSVVTVDFHARRMNGEIDVRYRLRAAEE